MSDYAKPLPEITDETRPFWDALRKEQLVLQQCARCAHIRYPISMVCPECLEARHEWLPLSGTGEVLSYIVFHQVYDKAFAGDVPYNVALIQLDEGPRMFSNVVGVPNDQVKVGDRVRIVFDAVTEEVTLPKFTPEGS
jgi:uncharacterized OB-fold protein